MVVPDEPTFKDLDSRLKQIKSIIGEVSIIIKHIEKNKPIATNNKITKTEPQKHIVSKLSEFMCLSNNKATRGAVLKSISKYARDNNLQKSQDKRVFLTDEKLSTLLRVDLNTKITFLGINKHISHLFMKK